MRTRTTSALESYNARLGEKIAGGSNFFKFAKCLIEEEAVKVKEFRELLRSGGAAKLTTKQTDRQRAIEDGTQLLLGNVCTIDDFLSRVSYSPGTKELCDNFNIGDISEMHTMPIDFAAVQPTMSPPAPSQTVSTPRTNRTRASTRASTRAASRNVSSDTIGIGVASSSQGIVPSNRRDSLDDFEPPTVSNKSSTITSVPNGTDCIGCCQERRSVLFLPCTHLVFCDSCYKRHCDVAMRKYQTALNSMPSRRRRAPEPKMKVVCPICVQEIKKTQRTILS